MNAASFPQISGFAPVVAQDAGAMSGVDGTVLATLVLSVADAACLANFEQAMRGEGAQAQEQEGASPQAAQAAPVARTFQAPETVQTVQAPQVSQALQSTQSTPQPTQLTPTQPWQAPPARATIRAVDAIGPKPESPHPVSSASGDDRMIQAVGDEGRALMPAPTRPAQGRGDTRAMPSEKSQRSHEPVAKAVVPSESHNADGPPSVHGRGSRVPHAPAAKSTAVGSQTRNGGQPVRIVAREKSSAPSGDRIVQIVDAGATAPDPSPTTPARGRGDKPSEAKPPHEAVAKSAVVSAPRDVDEPQQPSSREPVEEAVKATSASPKRDHARAASDDRDDKNPERRPHATEKATPDAQLPPPAIGLNPANPVNVATHATRDSRTSEPNPPPTHDATAQLVDRIRECVERLMVGVSPTGEAQVRMVLKEAQLPGVQLTVQRDAAQLVVVFETAVQASRQLLDRAATPLAKTLASKFGREVRVSVLDVDEPAGEFEFTASAGHTESGLR
jgi:hypothetical protein